MSKKTEAQGEIPGQTSGGELFETTEVTTGNAAEDTASDAAEGTASNAAEDTASNAAETSDTQEFIVLQNIWYKKKNRLAGTTLNLTFEEYIKLSQYLQPI